jgi:hypothetical protein
MSFYIAHFHAKAMNKKEMIRQTVEKTTDNYISVIKRVSKDTSEYQQLWKFNHAWDYLYGESVGFIIGACYNTFTNSFGRPPNNSEQAEMNAVLLAKAQEIREALKQLQDET